MQFTEQDRIKLSEVFDTHAIRINDSSVSVYGSIGLDIDDNRNKLLNSLSIPFKISDINDFAYIAWPKMKDLSWLPTMRNKQCTITLKNAIIKDFSTLAINDLYHLSLIDGFVESFKGLNEKLPDLRSLVYYPKNTKIHKGMLEILLHENLMSVNGSNKDSWKNYIIDPMCPNLYYTTQKIIYRRIGEGRRGMLAAQRELIELGVKEFI